MKKRFTYTKRDPQKMREDAEKGFTGGTTRDGFIRKDIESYVKLVKGSDYALRILPPTWENPAHWGIAIYTHYGIGGKNAYLCNKQMGSTFVEGIADQLDTYSDDMLSKRCAVCEERDKVSRQLNELPDGKEKDNLLEYYKTLKWSKKVLTWVVDRDREDEGPLLMVMAKTFDKEFRGLSINKRSGSVIYIDDPEEGHDIYFSFIDDGHHGKYSEKQIATEITPVSDDDSKADEWVNFIVENPLPKILEWHSYEHIKNVFEGNAVTEEVTQVTESEETIPEESGELQVETREDVTRLDDDDFLLLCKELEIKRSKIKEFDRPELEEEIFSILGLEEAKPARKFEKLKRKTGR